MGRESDLPKQFKITSKEVENYLSEEMARYANKLFEEYTPERTLRKTYLLRLQCHTNWTE